MLWYYHTDKIHKNKIIFFFCCNVSLEIEPDISRCEIDLKLRCLSFHIYMTLLSQRITKPTKLHVCPAKTQISLRTSLVWLESSHVRVKKAWVLTNYLSAQRKLIRLGGCPGWSVFAGRTYHFVGFVMHWLIYGRAVWDTRFVTLERIWFELDVNISVAPSSEIKLYQNPKKSPITGAWSSAHQSLKLTWYRSYSEAVSKTLLLNFSGHQMTSKHFFYVWDPNMLIWSITVFSRHWQFD